MLAASGAPLSVMKLLCDHSTSLDNALQCAAESNTEGRLEVMELLLDHGADIDAVKWKHHHFSYECFEITHLGTALHHAIMGGFKDRVQLLLSRGANIDIKNSLGQTAVDMARIIDRNDILTLLV